MPVRSKYRLAAAALVLLIVLLIAACSKINEQNLAKINEGMSETEVLGILGTPTESNSVSVLGVSGAVSRWSGRDGVIAVSFVNEKVALKTWEKPARN
jgi:hypothetical protein